VNCRLRTYFVLSTLAAFAAMLFHFGSVFAADSTSDPAQDPEGIVFNPTMGTYTVQRVPTRPLDAVLKSFAEWQHQVLADESTAEYVAEDGILSMQCSACGLSRPSAIEIATIDLKSLIVYQAGTWHIGIRSSDGAQDFFGVLRGELGSGPHDAARVEGNKRLALTALKDLHDLIYLTQNSEAAAKGAASKAAAIPDSHKKPGPTLTSSNTSAPKSVAISLAALASNGDVEAIQQRRGGNPRDIASALETAYGVRARAQLLEGHVDSALQTLSDGRQKFGKSAALREREASYVVIGDAYDRLRLAVKLDIAALRGYLQQIQSLESTDVTPIEQMLARTLAHRIADQRAAGRATVAGELLSAGSELFPAWADLLAAGASGALPESGVEVGTTATTAGQNNR
jgi:hypothetical protein